MVLKTSSKIITFSPYVVSGILTDEPALFANSWAVDLPRERACSSVDLDFSGPCQSESDMDVRISVAVKCKHNIDHIHY